MIVVDTSAYFAAVDSRDSNHQRAVETMSALIEDDADVATTNYIASETLSLVSRRLGMRVAVAIQRAAIGPSEMVFTTPIEHSAAVETFLESGRSLSFVDCATMATMRARDLKTIFTFDDDFARAGYTTIP